MLKLRDFISLEKIDWNMLSGNPNAIYLLEKNPEKNDWYSLSKNPNAIHILDENIFTHLREHL